MTNSRNTPNAYYVETTVDCEECGHDLLQHSKGCHIEGCGCPLTFTKAEARRAAKMGWGRG